MAERIAVLLDTDIGSDIDDAVALAYLLRQPRCELVGVTTVTGDVARRAACAQVVAAAAGRDDVPIHCGASTFLVHGRGQPNVPQYSAIEHLPHRRDWPANTAVDFMRQTIRQRPGQITLLSVGPLTNIAALFVADPQIPSLLKAYVCMAGAFFVEPEKREWNALVDPVATAIVYGARPPRHVSLGLDVTNKCRLPADEVRRRFVPAPLNVVARMAEVWFAQRPYITFHDPLAAAVIFRPELCQYADGLVRVPIGESDKLAGATLFSSEDPAARPHRVAKEVDPAAFFEEYFSVFQ